MCAYEKRLHIIDAVAYGGAHFGQAASTLSIHIDKLLCSGFEPRLINCPHDNHTLHCTHANDASVVCQQRKLIITLLKSQPLKLFYF